MAQMEAEAEPGVNEVVLGAETVLGDDGVEARLVVDPRWRLEQGAGVWR